MAIVLPGDTVTDLASVATFSGTEITDAARTAALSWPATQQGGSTDGATPPAGVGIFEALTNRFRRGQCDATTDWNEAQGTETIAVDAGVRAPFSPQSIAVTTPGSVSLEGCYAVTATGQAAAAGTPGAGSIYVNAPAGVQIDVWMRWLNTDTTASDGAHTVITGNGAFQLVTPASVAVSALKTGATLLVFVRTHATVATTFHVAHAELESGLTAVGPYIATSQGATATRALSQPTVPAIGLDTTQQWFVFRYVPFWSTTQPHFAVLLDWGDTRAGPESSRLTASLSGQQLRVQRMSAGTLDDFSGAAQTFVQGTSYTLGYRYTSTQLAVSFNGQAWQTVACNPAAIPPVGALLTSFSLGWANPNQFGTCNCFGAILWMMAGYGPIADADIAALAALADAQPNVGVPLSANPSLRWQVYAPVGPKFRRVSVGDTVTR